MVQKHRRFHFGLHLLALALVWMASFAFASADTIVLKDGRRIEGKVLEKTSKKIVVQSGVGKVEFKRSEVLEIIVKKSSREQFKDRFKSAKSADELYELGLWAQKKRQGRNAEKAFLRAVELEPKHALANQALGNVEYKGDWMKPEERDRRQAADQKAEMEAKGLVPHGDEWVTPEDKAKLDSGLVKIDGKWLDPDAAKRAAGLEDFEGAWLPLGEVLAMRDLRAAEDKFGSPATFVTTSNVLVAGEYEHGYLSEIGGDLDRARDWFNEVFQVPADLKLTGGRLAEFFLFERDGQAYVDSVGHFVSCSPGLQDEQVPNIQLSHGFYFFYPYAVASQRLGQREQEHLSGHCSHHWGHLMVNSLGYNYKLLPPWYDEGFASLTEFLVYDRNYVFCRAYGESGSGSKARGKSREFDTTGFRSGNWKPIFKQALSDGHILSFDRLAKMELYQLELIDVATGMMILDWIQNTGEPGALRRFHDEIRKTQPDAPQRVLSNALERNATYDRAFQAAVKMGWRQADKAWRAWVLEK